MDAIKIIKGGKQTQKAIDYSNNGVLYVNPNMKKGGKNCELKILGNEDGELCKLITEYKTNLYKTSDEDINDILNIYRSNARFQNHYHNIDNYYMYKIINENFDENYKIMPIKLRKYLLEAPKTDEVLEIKPIIHDKDEKYLIEELKQAPTLIEPEEVELNFSCRIYNDDIVQAYEKDYIDNFTNLESFIRAQNEYIGGDGNKKKGLSITDKITINDYTKKFCFIFYKAFVDSSIEERNNGKWFADKYRYNIAEYNKNDEKYKYTKTPPAFSEFGFGDSLFNQIFKVLGKEEFSRIVIPKIFISTALPEKYVFKDMDDYWGCVETYLKDRIHFYEKSIFADYDNKFWCDVLVQFINDINVIIMAAPRTNNNIYCYRGSWSHYILGAKSDYASKDMKNETHMLPSGTFASYRLGSFSINFDASKKYAVNAMYKITIKKGLPVLYLPSLSFASHEFEILHGLCAVYTIPDNTPQKSYNNKNNKTGILSNPEDEFNSVNVTLDGYDEALFTIAVMDEAIKKNSPSFIIGVDERETSSGSSTSANYAEYPPEIYAGGGVRKYKNRK